MSENLEYDNDKRVKFFTSRDGNVDNKIAFESQCIHILITVPEGIILCPDACNVSPETRVSITLIPVLIWFENNNNMENTFMTAISIKNIYIVRFSALINKKCILRAKVYFNISLHFTRKSFLKVNGIIVLKLNNGI